MAAGGFDPTLKTPGAGSMEEAEMIQAILDRATLRGARRMVLVLGEMHLGPADACCRATLESISDLTTLEALVKRVLWVRCWPEWLLEVLEEPPPRSRSKKRRKS
jgi:hypothetical protein